MYTWVLSVLLSDVAVDNIDGTLDIVVLNSAPLSFTLYNRLSSLSRMRICTDGGANVVHENYKGSDHLPTVIIGDFDSARSAVLDHFAQSGVVRIRDSDQDSTDLDKALNYIKLTDSVHAPRNPHYVSILGTVGSHEGRLDQFFAVIRAMYSFSDSFQLVSIGQQSVMMVLVAGNHQLVLPRKLVGAYCGIIPMFGEVDLIQTAGLKWNMNGPSSFAGLVSTSNEIEDATVGITTSHAVVFTITSPELL